MHEEFITVVLEPHRRVCVGDEVCLSTRGIDNGSVFITKHSMEILRQNTNKTKVLVSDLSREFQVRRKISYFPNHIVLTGGQIITEFDKFCLEKNQTEERKLISLKQTSWLIGIAVELAHDILDVEFYRPAYLNAIFWDEPLLDFTIE